MGPPITESFSVTRMAKDKRGWDSPAAHLYDEFVNTFLKQSATALEDASDKTTGVFKAAALAGAALLAAAIAVAALSTYLSILAEDAAKIIARANENLEQSTPWRAPHQLPKTDSWSQPG